MLIYEGKSKSFRPVKANKHKGHDWLKNIFMLGRASL